MNFLQQVKAMEKKERLKELAYGLGFDLIGVAGTSLPVAFQRFQEAVDEGRLGDLDYLTENPGLRRDVREVWPSARSVIVVGVSYADDSPSYLKEAYLEDEGYIARFARGRDYHMVVKKMLVALAQKMEADPLFAPFRSNDHRVFTDTGPVLEKAFAEAAGIGWQGKNTLLIHPGHRIEEELKKTRPSPRPERGRPLEAAQKEEAFDEFHKKRTVGRGSFYNLGVMLTPIFFEADEPERDHCGTCRLCIDACPTGALSPYKLEVTKCIAYWNVESKDPSAHLNPEQIGQNLVGCDICQEVCPWNRDPYPMGHYQLAPRKENIRPKLKDLKGLDQDAFIERFPASAIRRTDAKRMAKVIQAIEDGQKKKGEA